MKRPRLEGQSVRVSRRLGRAIARARHQAGLTQQSLCRQLGISESTLTKIERGVIQSPSVFTISQIAALTKTRVEDLIAGRAVVDQSLNAGPVKFVYFGVEDVLVDGLESLGYGLSHGSGLPESLTVSRWWRYWPALARGEMTADALAANLNLEADFAWDRFLDQRLRPFRWAIDILNGVSQQYPVGLLTDLPRPWLEVLIDGSVLPKINYKSIITADQVGLLKTEAGFYEKAGLVTSSPAEIVLISGCFLTLQQAKRHGWQTINIDQRPERLQNQIGSLLQAGVINR